MPTSPVRFLRRQAVRHPAAFWFISAMSAGTALLWLGLPPPAPRPRPPSPAQARLQALRTRLTAAEPIVPGAWRLIVIHHSATAAGNAARFDDHHRYERGWEGGLGYHFVIGNGSGSGDGEIEIGAHWVRQEQGTHVRNHNQGSIGICLVGDFESRAPTEAQMQALTDLVRCLLGLCRLTPNDIRTHRDLADTLCPGRHFPTEAFLKRLAEPAS
jgi:hypothetical protein